MPPAPPASSSRIDGRALTPAPAERGGFLLATCQGGAEASLRRRQELVLPELAPAAWRRGVVTFRLGGVDPSDDYFPDLVYARTVIRSLGQVSGPSVADRIAAVQRLAAHPMWDTIHVWHRDRRLEQEVDRHAIRAALLSAFCMPATRSEQATAGDLVLDCLIDTAERWWVGWHRAETPSSRQPGGMHPVTLTEDKVSRAWLKLDEAIAVFGLELERGQRAVELGCAPGGACQRLLESGLEVVGIDPALVDDRVGKHPGFAQWRMRARDVKVKLFRGFDWIVADMNIDPRSTLEALERIVTADGARPKGLITTLKLPDWSRAEELPTWLDRFRGWGYEPRARQVATAGREVCVAALRSRRN